VARAQSGDAHERDKFPFDVADGNAAPVLRCLAGTAAQRNEILALIGFIRLKACGLLV